MAKSRDDLGFSVLIGSLRSYAGATVNIVMNSALINVLTLAGSIFMMLVYDMVLPSRSAATLFGLLVVVSVAYAFQAYFDFLRARSLSSLAAAMEIELSGRVHMLVADKAILSRTASTSTQPIRDLEQIRAFLQSGGPTALMDLPWVPLFIGVLACFHIWLGVTALVGALLLVFITAVTERRSRAPARAVAGLITQRNAAMAIADRHAEAILALGMRGRTQSAWILVNRHYLAAQQRLSDVATGMGGLARTFRLLLQSVVLSVGALLVIDDKVTGGVIFASSILSARARSRPSIRASQTGKTSSRLGRAGTASTHSSPRSPLWPGNYCSRPPWQASRRSTSRSCRQALNALPWWTPTSHLFPETGSA